MKASEVLIRNEKGRKQITGTLRDSACGYCAVGALACEAGWDVLVDDAGLLWGQWFSLSRLYGLPERTPEFKCPRCGLIGTFPLGMVPHMNDDHNMTFAEIGEWLKQFEK